MTNVLIFFSVYHKDGIFYDGGCLHYSTDKKITKDEIKYIHDKHINQIRFETEQKIPPNQDMIYLITRMTFY